MVPPQQVKITMSKVLAELLSVPEVLAEQAVAKLEHLSGWQGTDVRLLAEANNKLRAKTKELGLDPDDTTDAELYHALRVKLAQDEKDLNLSSKEIIQKITQTQKSLKVYALKRSMAKDLLRIHPPKQLMKKLNYRSVDSMLKRENIVSLYAALPLVESTRWQNAFWKDLTKANPSDFESQQIEIVQIDAKRYELLKPDNDVTNVELLGSVAVWPNSLSGIGLSVQISQNINSLRAVCAYIKLRHVEADFGKSLVEILRGGVKDPLELAHMPISWHSILNHYGSRSAGEHTEYFGPHLLHEDIKTHYPVKALLKLSPVFNWWHGLEHVIQRGSSGLVSLNLTDVLASQSFNRRSVLHAQTSLWNEFIDRYFNHPSVEQYFMGQLELEPKPVPIEDYKPSRPEELEIRQLMESIA
jgi:hypothetical protein